MLLDQDWLAEGPLRDLGKATRLDEIDATLLSFSKREGKATKGTRIISLGNHDSWSTSLPEGIEKNVIPYLNLKAEGTHSKLKAKEIDTSTTSTTSNDGKENARTQKPVPPFKQ